VSEPNTFETGYGKPPEASRFVKGRSGNPKGRPKGSRNLAAIVLAESRELVNIQGPRGKRRITKLHASVMQLQNQAAKGHLQSQRELFGLVRMAEEAATSAGTSENIPEADQRMVESLLRRFKQIGAEGSSTQDNSKTENAE